MQMNFDIPKRAPSLDHLQVDLRLGNRQLKNLYYVITSLDVSK